MIFVQRGTTSMKFNYTTVAQSGEHCPVKAKVARSKLVGGAFRPSTIPDERVVEAYLATGNIRQCLLSLGLAAKGANYGRVKRALTMWGIEY